MYPLKFQCFKEKIQRQATKFILRDYNSDYRTGLLRLDLAITFKVDTFGPLQPIIFH